VNMTRQVSRIWRTPGPPRRAPPWGAWSPNRPRGWRDDAPAPCRSRAHHRRPGRP
jgi:hypothetical protein